jgi:hypothetical protein
MQKTGSALHLHVSAPFIPLSTIVPISSNEALASQKQLNRAGDCQYNQASLNHIAL